jgi:hypothetical protein
MDSVRNPLATRQSALRPLIKPLVFNGTIPKVLLPYKYRQAGIRSPGPDLNYLPEVPDDLAFSPIAESGCPGRMSWFEIANPRA